MYNSRMNPIQLVSGNRRSLPGRRRATVGAEFGICPDGSVVKGNPTPAKCGNGMPTGSTGTGYPPPGTITTPTYTPPPGGSGNPGPGTPWTPPGGSGNPGPGTPWTPPGNPGNCRPLCNPCPENQKRYYMPFVPSAGYTASVTAGSSVVFVGRPQKLFSPDRLIIGSTIGAYFDVVSLTIGNIPQSLSTGNVGAEMFSEVATYVMMTFDQAYPGIDIILTATNKSSVTQTFQAQLIGEAIG